MHGNTSAISWGYNLIKPVWVSFMGFNGWFNQQQFGNYILGFNNMKHWGWVFLELEVHQTHCWFPPKKHYHLPNHIVTVEWAHPVNSSFLAVSPYLKYNEVVSPWRLEVKLSFPPIVAIIWWNCQHLTGGTGGWYLDHGKKTTCELVATKKRDKGHILKSIALFFLSFQF